MVNEPCFRSEAHNSSRRRLHKHCDDTRNIPLMNVVVVSILCVQTNLNMRYLLYLEQMCNAVTNNRAVIAKSSNLYLVLLELILRSLR